jgi:hypothetical protein
VPRETEIPPASCPERRREPRAAVEIGATLHLGGRAYVGLVRDLSPAGAYIELMDRDPFPHEGVGRLSAGPFGGSIAAAIRSKRLDPGGAVLGLGLEFMELGADGRARIARLIEERRARSTAR